MIAMIDEPGVDLGHLAEQQPLVGRQVAPRPHRLVRRPALALRSLDVRVRVARRQAGPFGHEPELDLTREHELAIALVAHVEPAAIAVDPVSRRVVRRVRAARREVEQPRLVGRRGRGIADVPQRVVGEIDAEVITVVRSRRRRDALVVLLEQRIPLAGLGAEEPVEPLEPAAERPLAARARGVTVAGRRQVPLADRPRAVAVLDQHFRDQGVLERDPRIRSREAGRVLRDAGHRVRARVAAGEQARLRRRAEPGAVELRVAKARVRQPSHRRRLDQPAVAVERAEPDVVPHDVEDVRSAIRRAGHFVRSPVRCRLACIERDPSSKLRRHDASLSNQHSIAWARSSRAPCRSAPRKSHAISFAPLRFAPARLALRNEVP